MRLPIHPAMKPTDAERAALGVWLGKRRKRGLSGACYGIWKVFAPQMFAENRARFLAGRSEAIKKARESNRKRPTWCSENTWKAWREYRRRFCGNIPLEVYVDPQKRRAWLEKRHTRPMTPREMAEATLKRLGLQPKRKVT